MRTQSQGHHTIDRLEERGVDRGFLDRRSSLKDEHWNCSKGNVVETSERRDGTHMGFSEGVDTILQLN